EVGLEQAEVNGVDQVVSGEISPRIVAVLPLRFAECGRQYSKVHGVHYVAVVAVTRSQQAHFLVVRAVGYVDAPRVRQGLRRLYAPIVEAGGGHGDYEVTVAVGGSAVLIA